MIIICAVCTLAHMQKHTQHIRTHLSIYTHFYAHTQARQLLQDYNEAIEDFKEVLKIEPTNKAAQKEIIQTRNKLKAYHDKEKKKYAKMFEMLADHTQQEPESSER